MTDATIDRAASSPSPGGHTAYDYRAVQVPRARLSLYRGVYESFGWDPVGAAGSGVGLSSTVLEFKRDRAVRNRSLLLELERRAEASLHDIEVLERSRCSRPRMVGILLGVLGSGLLAGSVFTLGDGRTAVSVVLGVAGLLSWVSAYPCFRRLRARRAAVVVQLLEEQVDRVHDACVQVSRLRT